MTSGQSDGRPTPAAELRSGTVAMRRFIVVGFTLVWLVAHADYSVPRDCNAYVACFERTGGTKGALDSSYGAQGYCWTTTDSVWFACDVECGDKLQRRIRDFPDAGCELPSVSTKTPPVRGCGI